MNLRCKTIFLLHLFTDILSYTLEKMCWFFSVCGAIYTDEKGTIVSPGYPNNYDNNLDCGYTIIANPQHFIVVQFTEFAVEGARNKYTPTDWGHISDGSNSTAPPPPQDLLIFTRPPYRGMHTPSFYALHASVRLLVRFLSWTNVSAS